MPRLYPAGVMTETPSIHEMPAFAQLTLPAFSHEFSLSCCVLLCTVAAAPVDQAASTPTTSRSLQHPDTFPQGSCHLLEGVEQAGIWKEMPSLTQLTTTSSNSSSRTATT